MAGPGRPGVVYKTKLSGKSGTTLTFSSPEVTLTAVFTEPEEYFENKKVGDDFAIDFSDLDSRKPVGGNSPKA